MSADESTPVAATARDAFAAQLRQLEEFVARAESEGEALPPALVEMMSRVREIMAALDGLSPILASLTSPPPAAASAVAKPEPS